MQRAYTISSIAGQDLDNPAALFEDLIAHHSPFAAHLFGWVDAGHGMASGYLPLAHDIECRDGTLIEGCFPGTGGWVAIADAGRHTPFEAVARVRLATRQPTMNGEWQQRGRAGALSAPL